MKWGGVALGLASACGRGPCTLHPQVREHCLGQLQQERGRRGRAERVCCTGGAAAAGGLPAGGVVGRRGSAPPWRAVSAGMRLMSSSAPCCASLPGLKNTATFMHVTRKATVADAWQLAARCPPYGTPHHSLKQVSTRAHPFSPAPAMRRFFNGTPLPLELVRAGFPTGAEMFGRANALDRRADTYNHSLWEPQVCAQLGWSVQSTQVHQPACSEGVRHQQGLAAVPQHVPWPVGFCSVCSSCSGGMLSLPPTLHRR